MKRTIAVLVVLAVLVVSALYVHAFTGFSPFPGDGVTRGSANVYTKVNAASGSASAATYSGTLGIMNGSDTFRSIFLDYTNANHTGTGNYVIGIDIDAIAGDANANLIGFRIGNLTATTGAAGEVEYGIQIGTGWDYGLYNSSPTYLGYLPAAGSSGNAVLLSGSPAAMDGSDLVTGIRFTYLPNASNHTGASNYLSLVYVDAMTGEADLTTWGIYIGAMTGTAASEVGFSVMEGWDYGLYSKSPVYVGDGTNSATTSATGSITMAGTAALSINGTGLLTAAGGILETKTITADIDNQTLTAADMGKVWTNLDDSDGTIFTLPEASTVLGKSITFVVLAAQNLDVNPADGTDQILYGGCAAGDALRADAAGETLTLMAVGANSWVVLSVVGTWTDVN